MNIRRNFAAVAASLLAAMLLAACMAQSGSAPAGDAGGDEPGAQIDLADTTWSGVDSDESAWVFEFQDDGTVDFSFDGVTHAEESHTWVLSGDTLDIDVDFLGIEVLLTGDVEAGAIELQGTQLDHTFTLTITED